MSHISRPAVSKHLRILKEAQLVSVTRIGREHWYQLNTAPLAEVHRWLSRYERFWQRKLESLKEMAEEIEENDLQD